MIRTKGALIRFLPYLHHKDHSMNSVSDKEMVDCENHTVDSSTRFDQIVGVIDAEADDICPIWLLTRIEYITAWLYMLLVS